VHGLSTCQVTSAPHYTEPNAITTAAGQIWTGLAWPADQTSEITLQTLTQEGTTNVAALFVRLLSNAVTGYQASIQADPGPTLHFDIYRLDAGTATQLTTVSAASISSGDVFSFQAAGAQLSLYQNGTRVLYFYDATYPSGGSPGFELYAGANITHSQVASWRGYNAIQQDGVWQKQGIIIPATSSDLAVGIYIPTQVLFEGNAQILSGTVYKVWFGSNAGASGNIYYAESLDGINWTRHGSAVISGQLGPAIIKNGSTYYMYTQPSTSFGTGDFALYTSTDGINWTSVNAHVLSLGGAGAWDSVVMFTFAPVVISGGTWYALYSASNAITPAATAYIGKTGLATSSDGINWTKYGSNPVVNGWITQATYRIGGLWYTWIQQNQLGQANPIAGGLDPTETVRYSSPDLITWTKSSQSIHHSQQFEGVNTNTGQSFINSMINVGGRAYAYLNSDPNDSAQPSVFQIGLAIAPVSIAGLVTQPEDAAQQVTSDNFTRANGSLGPNWATPTGGTALQIASNLAEASATSTHCGQYYSGATFAADQYSEVTLATQTSNGFVYPIVRVQPGAVSWYEAPIHGGSGAGSAANGQIFKMVAGVETQIGATVTFTPQLNDKFRLQVTTGSDGFPILELFQNGFLLLQVEDYSNAFTSGNPGISMFAGSAVTDAQVSLWAGGNANVIPNYNASSGAANFMLLGCGQA